MHIKAFNKPSFLYVEESRFVLLVYGLLDFASHLFRQSQKVGFVEFVLDFTAVTQLDFGGFKFNIRFRRRAFQIR